MLACGVPPKLVVNRSQLRFMSIHRVSRCGSGSSTPQPLLNMFVVADCPCAFVQCAAGGQNAQDPSVFINDIELYLQCIFTQLDLLQQWVQKQQEICDKAAEQAAQQQQQQAAQQKGGASSRSNNSSNTPEVQLAPFVANVAELVSTIPIQTMAQAALK